VKGSRLGITTQDTDDISVGETQDLAKRLVKGKSVFIGRDDGSVASSHKAEMGDFRGRQVSLGATLEDER
jgi:hypothetical protein